MTRRNLFQNGLAFLMCLFLFAGVSAQTTKTVRLDVGTTEWTVPTTLDGSAITVTSVTFEAWGGGGAGGYAFSNNAVLRPTAGGGGGAYAKSATITDMTPGESFTIVVGAGGTAIGDDNTNYTVIDGGTSTVSRGTNLLVKAVGGKTVTGYQNWENPGAGGSASECEGVVKHSGGHGGKADRGGNDSGAFCISGSGGGAGGPSGNGGDAEDSWGEWIVLWYRQITGAVGTGGGSLAGSGALGWESQIIGEAGWGNQEGRQGNNYGGGGSGAISNNVAYGDANGGAGGPGAILVTYTYVPAQEISANNASATICSGTSFDIPLDITATGFDLANAHMTYGGSGTVPAGVNYSASVEFKTSDNKWHAVGNASNTNTETKAFALSCTVSTADNSQTVPFTVTVNVYGKLDGGVIAENQLVCHEMSIQQLTSVQDATGGSGNGSYKWIRWDEIDVTDGVIEWGAEVWSDFIEGANAPTYLPTLQGTHFYARAFDDSECGIVYALGENNNQYLQVTTVDPLSFSESYSSEDTICSNESYSKTIGMGFESPVSWTGSWGYSDIDLDWYIYWQKSTDKGATWENLTGLVWDVYNVSLTPSDFSAGDDIWYRAALKINDCDSVPSNAIYKIHVKEIPDYTGQFPDVNITLWYGACDTSIAALVPPVLTPTPVSITRADSYGDRLTPGEYELRWNVIADDCNIPVEYTQNVKVEYPACGTLAEPLTMTDNDGNEYQTIRIGCECWMAENLRTNAPEAVYYNEDPANESFGKLYTWADAVGCNETPKETMSGATYVQGILPDEWSIPTMAQYTKLLEYFNTEQLKSDEADSWLPDYLGTNESGFNLMGSGYYDVEFQRLRGYADLWVVGVTSSNPDKAPVAEFRYDCDGTINCVFVSKTAKMSVRGVRVSPAVQPFTCGTSKMKDAEGNEYETVEIGTQCWTKSNLRSTKDKNGNDLVNGGTTASMTDPYYYVNSSVDASVYGHYYNWEAAKLVCPTGWHLPSDAEWTTLTNYIKANYSCDGNISSIAKALASTDGWKSTNGICYPGDQSTYANNESGFSAFPAGCFDPDYSSFRRMSEIALFSSSDLDTICDPSSTTNQQNRSLWFNLAVVMHSGCWPLDRGMSVRCVKD